ncbi:MAG: IS66 family transposase [Devosia sp.]|jgi:transposase|uniref:IS66 family transposase n=1 Tax=unclassified Devosia TaxID=196773 RepID=UPI0019EEE0D3|nr:MULTISPECIES: IS66 family transposase [unclassified Devosia]MBF0677304.1 IS66 family transposase [Devosia sp.]WEJ31375.1 IS66 family transposase [Devosia sp. SD17-2]WEJ32983.1 IS66 family transposase [Devosia sp. SD17-2]WEJ34631.1 IS66 family transposase [Devosia sp. SD17-2]
MLNAAELPDDIAALKAMLIAAEVRDQRKDERIAQLEKLVAAFKQAAFGRRSEKSDPDQFELALEDLETAIAVVQAEEDAEDRSARRPAKPRSANRGSLPKHLPRIEEIIEPQSLVCGCGGCLHRIGEDVSERLDVIPAQFRVIVTRRPKYACRFCTDGVVQAPAPGRLIPGGLPTEAMVAHVLVSKYADHLPLYRQAQIFSRQGVDLDRSTLADWVGRAAFELRPVYDALLADLKRSSKLFMDETRAPVLDPGTRKTKTGYFWALARDDRPWSGTAPPGVAFTYAPGRGGLHAERILQGFGGILQVDGYAGYNRLIAPGRVGSNIRLAYCWAHARRKLVDITRAGNAPIAEEGVRLIRELYSIEADIRGQGPDDRLAARQQRSAPAAARIREWLDHHRARVSAKAPLGEALGYIAKYWPGLVLFLADGRIELDNNAVERTIRPIALNRKNALFAGHDAGAENWAVIASLIETCKLNGVDPYAWLATTLRALVSDHKQSRINDLLPWNYASQLGD